jgi:hypothetical protein
VLERIPRPFDVGSGRLLVLVTHVVADYMLWVVGPCLSLPPLGGAISKSLSYRFF